MKLEAEKFSVLRNFARKLSRSGALVMDSFAGTCSTAKAHMLLGSLRTLVE